MTTSQLPCEFARLPRIRSAVLKVGYQVLSCEPIARLTLKTCIFIFLTDESPDAKVFEVFLVKSPLGVLEFPENAGTLLQNKYGVPSASFRNPRGCVFLLWTGPTDFFDRLGAPNCIGAGVGDLGGIEIADQLFTFGNDTQLLAKAPGVGDFLLATYGADRC